MNTTKEEQPVKKSKAQQIWEGCYQRLESKCQELEKKLKGDPEEKPDLKFAESK